MSILASVVGAITGVHMVLSKCCEAAHRQPLSMLGYTGWTNKGEQMNAGKVATVIGIGVAIIVAVFLFLSGVSDEDPQLEDATGPNDTTSQESNTIEADGDDVDSEEVDQELTIDMKNFKFSMSQISAAPGETITVNLTNSGGTHNFVIEELDVKSQTINSGETTSITFKVPEDASGDYAFFCDIGNHREMGMEGTLTVSG